MVTKYSPFYLVEQFHLTYGHKVRIHPQINIPERQLRTDLIAEEVEELSTAWHENDMVEVIDALADIVYVACGASLAHGFLANQLLNLDANTTPADQVEKEDGGINGFPHFNTKALEQLVPQIENLSRMYEEAINENDTVKATHMVAEIVLNCYRLSARMGVNLDTILTEVQASNMSKLGADGKPILREDGKILKGPNFFVPNILLEIRKQGYTE